MTYLMEALRSLIVVDLNWEDIWPGFAVVIASGVLMVWLNVRSIAHYG